MQRRTLFVSLLLCSAISFLTSSVYAEETTTVVTPVTTVEGTPAQKTTTTTVKDNGTVESREVIVTQSPAPQEVIVPPTGYQSCQTIDAGWYNDEWVPAHQVCKYSSSTEGVAWVEGYWACTKYKASACIDWQWKSGHWVKTFTTY